MALLSDDEDGFGSRQQNIRRAGRPTNSTLFSSELPSFDSRSDPNTSYGGRRGGAGGADVTMVDVDDEELYAEGEETKVRALMRRWMDERLAPDLLPWQGELVAEILEMLQSQNEIAAQLQGNVNTTEEEHFAVMLVQTEVERVKFVLRSYLRSRLNKIEKYTPFILATPEVQRNLSELEQNYVQRFGDLMGSHFKVSTLNNLPAHMHSLAEENPNMPSMRKGKNRQTRFPVARIKRIMQKDEEVGKVAQATPVVISKALELFMQDLVGASSRLAEERGGRRIEAYHLKQAIENTEMFDFLKDLVQGVADPTNGGTISEMELAAAKAEGNKKPRKRKPKVEQAEEDEDE
ncbi:hypothetical protein M408DRAFT_7549 [Serendipita vermifera MAFF 305830]|uniref:Transcription factor CBF/NF-Y/archaeal histone domain-containing protein n=1 Tax=Serendipita vermifera MAFF 305830 TaxID=933852 RepID=A0A0C3B122_SERVB|nr:hypothetical protein M408DRAFT_7549 [Serendipita vermifera MAFF 305830]